MRTHTLSHLTIKSPLACRLIASALIAACAPSALAQHSGSVGNGGAVKLGNQNGEIRAHNEQGRTNAGNTLPGEGLGGGSSGRAKRSDGWSNNSGGGGSGGDDGGGKILSGGDGGGTSTDLLGGIDDTVADLLDQSHHADMDQVVATLSGGGTRWSGGLGDLDRTQGPSLDLREITTMGTRQGSQGGSPVPAPGILLLGGPAGWMMVRRRRLSQT